jgi:predicted NAD-dependent protein-ADP-ribosyltransferase YbiA (DUF1768 family)
MYEDDLYPKALHLFQAHEFLDHGLGDRIRRCECVEKVTTIGAELTKFTRRDRGNVALSTVSSPFLPTARALDDLC